MSVDTASTDPPQEFSEDAWKAMLQRNAERDKPKCQTVAIDDMALGPGHVAWKFILACKAEQPSIAFNDEQIDCMAWQNWDIEEAPRKRQGSAASPAVLPNSHVLAGGQTEAIRLKYLLPNDLGLCWRRLWKNHHARKGYLPHIRDVLRVYGTSNAVQQICSTLQSKDGAFTKWIQAFRLTEGSEHTHSH